MIRKSFFPALIFAVLFIGSAFAQDAEFRFPEELLQKADTEIFLKAPVKADFQTPVVPVNDILEGGSIHRISVKNDIAKDSQISILPSGQDSFTNHKSLVYNSFLGREFHARLSFSIEKAIPEEGGSCWLKYSNVYSVGAGRDSGVLFVPGDGAFSYCQSENGTEYTQIKDLSELTLNDEENIIDVIRINGISYFYFNKEFVFMFEDGITDMLSFESGSALFQESNVIQCVFTGFEYQKN